MWADAQDSDFASTIPNEFNIRAQNGVRIQSNVGIHLQAGDLPMLVRDWDPFSASATAGKAGIGRWGMFMEPGYLTLGIPNLASRYFQIVKYNADASSTQLMQVDQSGAVSAAGGIRLNDKPAFLRSGSDTNHGLAYCGLGATNFSPSVLPDGPVLWGYAGGALGTVNPNAHSVLNWTSIGVNIASSAENQNSPPTLTVTGTRQGGIGTPVAFVHNTYLPNILTAAPALRVVNEGNSPDGALSVSTQGTGLIARFGNSGSFVADITTSGTIDAVAFNTTSDRNAKENFSSIDAREILEKVTALPLSKWNYKQDKDTRHIGPMAQDFKAAFDVGSDDRHIATVDEEGVALAAIQGLNEVVKERDAQITRLELRLSKLEKLVTKLEKENISSR